MRMKHSILFLLVLCLCLGLCACGGKSPAALPTDPVSTAAQDSTAEAETPALTEPAQTEASKTMTWGDWTVEVPAGFELEGGDFLDENDPRYFSVKESFTVFFDFKADGEELIMHHYNYNKETYTNEQKDVKGSFGGIEWTGFQYSDGFGGYGFEAYTTIDGEMIRVSVAGYAFDDEMVDLVLGSLRHTPADPSAQESAEAAETGPAEELAAPTAKVIVLKDGRMAIRAGYTEMKDATPAQYVMVNDETGGKVSIWNSSGTPADGIASTMAGQDYELREEARSGLQWTVAVNEGFYCFGTALGDRVLLITIDYGGTEEEMAALMDSFTPNSEE